MNALQPDLSYAQGGVSARRQQSGRARLVEGDEARVLVALGRLVVAGQRRAFSGAQAIAAWLDTAPPLDERAVADALLLLTQRGLTDSSSALLFPPAATARYRLTQAGVAAICQLSQQNAPEPAGATAYPKHRLHLVPR